MKRLLLLLVFCLLIGAASATSLNFQNPVDNASVQKLSYGSPSPSTLTWIRSSTGGNNYMQTISHGGGGDSSTYFILNSPSTSTYAAATLISDSSYSGGRGGEIGLFDSSKNALAFCHDASSGSTTPGRYEVKISGGQGYCYFNGTLFYTTAVMAQNPSYIGFGSKAYDPGGTAVDVWDQYVYGQTENKYILGLPESDNETYIIQDDFINSANNGLAFGENGTQVNANYMTGQWSRGNASIPPDPLDNMTIQLVSYPTNTVYAENYIGTAYTGTVTIDIKTKLLDAGAPDGYYALYIPGTGAYSNPIIKKSNGAVVTFNSDTYSTGDTATVVYYVLGSGYWDSAYTYKLSIYSLTDGFLENTTLTTQTGSVTHAWSETDTLGVVYALLYATDSSGVDHLLGLDWATLSSYVNFYGYVQNAENGTIISGANVSMTQGSVVCNTLSTASGYNCTGFSTGAVWYVNATASGYRQYTFNNTPLAAKGINLTIVLEPITPVYTGLAIGGVDRDTVYGRPVSGATVEVWNTTTAEHYTKTTSSTGWYLCDAGSSCNFAASTPYWVRGSKLGYSNSSDYTAVTA